MPTSSLNLTLVIDIATASNAPNFFSMLALVLRASGAEVIILGADGKTGPLAASYNIAFTEVIFPKQLSRQAPARVFQAWKRRQVIDRLNNAANHKVVWVDNDFSDWQVEQVDGTPNLVILNWEKVAMQMRGTNQHGSMAPAKA